MDIKSPVYDVCYNPRHTRWIAPLVVACDALLCVLIVWKIPYTEIDWTTYMEQVSQYISGERDYTLIKGSTGPLVYPAAHVYIYTLLYHLTNQGRDILLGQVLFAILYLITLAVVVTCYARSGAPPYLLPLLVLSKRLHSVFMLRLFNDGVAAFAIWVALLLFQRRKWEAGVVVWSVGVGVKMTLLLLVPAIGVILVLSLSFGRCVQLGVVALLVQILLAIPFLQVNPWGYVCRAFELTRQFMFKWTVNWRFIGQEIFLSKWFSLTLLIVHTTLLFFFVSKVWLKPTGRNPFEFLRGIIYGRQRTMQLSNSFILTTSLTSVVIGMLCARSLHYQFFAYLSWATPFLLWRGGFGPFSTYALWALQEWAWNVYPSTNASSVVLVSVLFVQGFGVLWDGQYAVVSGDGRDNCDVKEHLQ